MTESRQIQLLLQVFLIFQFTFRISLSISTQKPAKILTGTALHLLNVFGRIDILTTLSLLPINKWGTSVSLSDICNCQSISFPFLWLNLYLSILFFRFLPFTRASRPFIFNVIINMVRLEYIFLLFVFCLPHLFFAPLALFCCLLKKLYLSGVLTQVMVVCCPLNWSFCSTGPGMSLWPVLRQPRSKMGFLGCCRAVWFWRGRIFVDGTGV